MRTLLRPALGIVAGLLVWQLLPGVTSKVIAFVVCTGFVAYHVRRDRKRTTALLVTVAILSASALPPSPVQLGPDGENVPALQAAEMSPWLWFAAAIAGGVVYDGFMFLAGLWWEEASACCPANEGGMSNWNYERPPPPKCLVPGRNTYTGCVD